MWTSWKFWAVWMIVLGLIILLSFGFTTDPKIVPSPLMGRLAPDFKVNELNGEQKFSLSEFKGMPIVLNFWASWCAPCRIEHPILMKLSQKKNLMLLGINFKDKELQAKTFLSELGNPYDLLAKDKNGKHSVKFGIYGIPESILINKELLIIQKFVGPLSVDDYNNIIKIIE